MTTVEQLTRIDKEAKECGSTVYEIFRLSQMGVGVKAGQPLPGSSVLAVEIDIVRANELSNKRREVLRNRTREFSFTR